MARKTVYIPLVALAGPEAHRVLELIVEAAPRGTEEEKGYEHLRACGLESAVEAAQVALKRISAAPLSAGERWQLTLQPPPAFFVVNPTSSLSQSAGASLGIALGTLMYEGLCPMDRVIAVGRVEPRNFQPLPIEAVARRVRRHLRAGLSLGHQETTLAFFLLLPGAICDAVLRLCASVITALERQNIVVIAISSLDDVVSKYRGPS